MIEVDLEFDAEALRMRPQLAVAIVFGDANGLQDPDVAPRHRQRDQADLIDRVNERRRAAVHDRHFRPVDLDDGVVDAETRQRGEHMLGGRAERPGGVAEDGGKFGGGDGADVGAISRSGWPSMPQRTNTMPVSASAGSMVSVAGDPNARQCR